MAAVGSAINSIAGAGTLVTFPAIVALGVPPLIANATSTVGLLPGSIGSVVGYRQELTGAHAWLIRFTLPSLAGGALGGWFLLRIGAEWFERVVPYLVLGATVLFMLRGPLMAWLSRRRGVNEHSSSRPESPRWAFLVAQFGVGVYGGYFGAGIGILMLATLGLMGLSNIHLMNGLKNWGGFCMNLVAAAIFALNGVVLWPLALVMGLGSVLGGYVGARMAQRVGQAVVRRAVVVIGFAAFIWLLTKPF